MDALEQEADRASAEIRLRHDRRINELGDYPKKGERETDSEYMRRCKEHERAHDAARQEARAAMDKARQAHKEAHAKVLEQARKLVFGEQPLEAEARQAAEQITDKATFHQELRRLHSTGEKRQAVAFASVAWTRGWDTLAASVLDAKALVLLDILETGGGSARPGVSRWIIR